MRSCKNICFCSFFCNEGYIYIYRWADPCNNLKPLMTGASKHSFLVLQWVFLQLLEVLQCEMSIYIDHLAVIIYLWWSAEHIQWVIIGSIKLFRLESITQWMELPVLKKRLHCNSCSKDRVIDVTFWCHSLFLNTHLPFKELSPKTCSFHCIQFLIWFKLRRFNLKNMITFLIFCIHFC